MSSLGITKAYRKGLFRPLIQGLKGFIDRKRREDAKKRLIELMGDFETGLGELSQSFKGSVDRSFDANPNFQNREAFDQGLGKIQSDFIEGLIPETGNLRTGQVNLALGNIESLVQANRPGEPIQPDIRSFNPTNELVDFNTGETVREGTPKQKQTNINFSARGYWDVSDPKNPKWIPNPEYRLSKEDEQPDYSRLIGEVNEGIETIRNLNKTAQFEGDNVSFTDGSDQFNMTVQQFKAYKEKKKNPFKQPALQMINQQGLDNAVKDIRQLLKSEGSLDAALSKFIELNGDSFDDEDIRLLRDYFTLLTL